MLMSCIRSLTGRRRPPRFGVGLTQACVLQEETCAEAGEAGESGAEEPVVEEPKLSRVRHEDTSEYLWRWGWRICAGLAALSTLLCVAMPGAGVVE